MSVEWDNFVRGINRSALESERLPRLADPELERPGAGEDTRMRSRHAVRRDAFYETAHRPQKLTALEARRLDRLRARIIHFSSSFDRRSA